MQNTVTKKIVMIFYCKAPKMCIISKLIQVRTSTDTDQKVRIYVWSQMEKLNMAFEIDMANSSTPRTPSVLKRTPLFL